MVKISDFGELSALEAEILEKAPTGEQAGVGELPRAGDATKRVRPDLLRALLLGEIEGVPLHPKGADIGGAWVDGDLDFGGCKLKRPVILYFTRFGGKVVFQDAQVPALYLSGSYATHVDLHRLICKQSLHLRAGFKATAGVDLAHAKIVKNLVCEGSEFANPAGLALDCEAMTVGADVFLRDGLKAEGRVDFTRARITGNLHVKSAELRGIMKLESARIEEGFFWTGVTGEVGLNLTDASVGVLRDEKDSWDCVCGYILKGFRYVRIDSDLTIGQRLKGLSKKVESKIKPAFELEEEIDGEKVKNPVPWAKGVGQRDFDPQPYTQLAKVLDSQGNRSGAARVLAQREHRQRKAARMRAHAHLDGSFYAGAHSLISDIRPIWSTVFRFVFGYGHHPALSLLWVFAIWMGAAWLYGAAYAAGQMAPNSDVVLTSDAWLAAVNAYETCTQTCVKPLTTWLATPDAQDYETFNRFIYGLDLFVPLDALGQESTWAPSKVRGPLGWWA